MLNLELAGVQDAYSRENFRSLRDELSANPLTRNLWHLRELTFLAAVTNLLVPHGLKFLPKDIIITSTIGAGQLTINYSKTDLTNLNLTTTGACVVRLLLGSLG